MIESDELKLDALVNIDCQLERDKNKQQKPFNVIAFR